jgi:hypothetical protein
MKMKNIYFLFLMIVVVGMCEKISAQSRWVGIMPMEFNPSFAGNVGGHRLVTFAGYTSTKEGEGRMKGNYVNRFDKESMPVIGFSYDNFIPKLATGIGFFASWMNENRKYRYSDSHFSGLKTGVVVSPKISIKGKYTIAPSLGLTYKRVEGEINDYNPEETRKSKHNAFNLSAGLLFNSERFYMGFAYYFSPFTGRDVFPFYEDIKQSQIITQMYGIVQAGYKFQRNKESKTSYTIQSVVRLDKYFEWPDLFNNLSFIVKHKKFLLGASTADGFSNFFSEYPPQDALYAGIGYQTSRFKIFYSQDLTNLKFRYRCELSFRLFLPNKNKTISHFN